MGLESCSMLEEGKLTTWAGTTPATQFDHLCPSGYYCYNRTSDESYRVFPCEPGYYCPPGVWIQPSVLGSRYKCPRNEYQPEL